MKRMSIYFVEYGNIENAAFKRINPTMYFHIDYNIRLYFRNLTPIINR